MSKPYDYGQFYWCVKLATKEEIYVNADVADISQEHVYAASTVDGTPVAVDHWFQNYKERIEIGFSEPK